MAVVEAGVNDGGRLLEASTPRDVVDGVGVEIENLAGSPASSSAEVQIVPTGGPSTLIPLTARAEGCDPEGGLRFDGDRERAVAAAHQGGAPYRYMVTVVLD